MIFSWLILTEAHPLDGEDEEMLINSVSFSSNKLPHNERSKEEKGSLIRNKRTIGFLRQLFPGLSQIIDRKIQQITRILFRVVGRLILRGGNGGASAAGGGNGGSEGRKISITLPTYPPVDDEEEETEPPTEKVTTASSSEPIPDIDTRVDGSETSSTQANTSSSTLPNTEIPVNNGSTSESNISTDLPDSSNTIIRKSRDVSDVLSDTTLSFDEELSSTEASTKRSGFLWRLGNDMRNKRGNSLTGGGGGSANFIFDLIRLIAGSGVTPEKDEELNAPRDERDENSVNADTNDVDSSSESSYNPEEDTSGIPGPLTRFALLVNRGISNVFKDLILRIAQTSERIVNFKARLLTAII